MPTRRTVLRACTALGLCGATPTATASRSTAPGRPTDEFDPRETLDALRALGGPAVGRVDLAALRASDRSLDATLDHAVRRRVPRSADPVATWTGRSVLRELRGSATVRSAGRTGGHAVYDVESSRGRAALGRRGDRLVAAVPRAGSTARHALVDRLSAGSGAPLPGPVADAFADADGDAFISVPVGTDPPGGLDGVTALGLGVTLDADRPFLARFQGEVDPPRARSALAALGVPLGVLSDLEFDRDPAGLTLRATVDRQTQVGGSFLLFLLAVVLAVLGTFVLGVGTEVESTAPEVSFAFDYDRETGRVRITHAGGDTIGSDASVSVRYTRDGEVRVERWHEPDGISAGDQYTTENAVDPGTEVRVVWGQGERTRTLGSFRVPS